MCSKEGKGQRSIDDFRDPRAYHSENGQNQWVAGKVGGVLWSFLEPEYAWFISKSLQLQFCATQHTFTYLTASICATESCISPPLCGQGLELRLCSSHRRHFSGLESPLGFTSALLQTLFPGCLINSRSLAHGHVLSPQGLPDHPLTLN